MKTEQIKLGLLGIISLTLIVQTYYTIESSSLSYRKTELPTGTPSSNMVSSSTNNSMTPDMPNPATQINDAVEDNTPKTTISFAESEHNFGSVNQDSENKHVFKFTNTGTEPLIITNAKGSCGCTVPTYPKEPIAPGATGDIEVVYKPGKQKGSQTKTVTVTANTEPSNTVVYIKADVQEI